MHLLVALACERPHVRKVVYSSVCRCYILVFSVGFDTNRADDGLKFRRTRFHLPNPFATDFRSCYFDAAAVANGAFIADAFIFTAMAFPIARGTEYPFAEEPVAFGLQGTIVNGFGLFDFAVRSRRILRLSSAFSTHVRLS